MAQSDTKEVVVDGVTYQFRFLDPLTASDMLVDLSKVLGPVIAEVGSGLLGDNAGDGIEGLLAKVTGDGGAELAGGVSRGIRELFDRVKKEQLREMMTTLAGVCAVQVGDKWPELAPIFQHHFRGRVGHMYQWFFAALGAQFSDFFGSMGNAINRGILRAGLDPSSSPTT